MAENRLSLDQMIGIFCLCFLFAASGYNLKLAAYGFSIASIVLAWRLLRRVAPVTADSHPFDLYDTGSRTRKRRP